MLKLGDKHEFKVGDISLAGVVEAAPDDGPLWVLVYGVDDEGEPRACLNPGAGYPEVPDVVDLAVLLAGCVFVDLTVENRYEDGDLVTVMFTGQPVIAPPHTDEGEEAHADWAYENIYEPFTGTGREDGDSWHDVEVTGSSDPALVGNTYEWGY